MNEILRNLFGNQDEEPDQQESPGSAGGEEPEIRRRAPGPRPPMRPPGGAPPLVRFAPGRGALVLVVVVFAIIVVLAALGPLMDLWTDSIWYGSVGYGSVFWTRLGTQVALFLGVGAAVLVLLLLNLWLAARLSPPPDPEGRSSLAALFQRLGEAQRRSRDNTAFSAFAAFGRDAFGRGGLGREGPAPTVDVSEEELPDLTPIASVGLVLLAVFAALIAAGGAAAAWETVALWLNRVPYSPAGGQAVTDPIFNRDVSFYFFELPFWRYLQGLASAVLIAALLLAAGRYGIGVLRGGLRLRVAARLHLGVLGALLLAVFAAGYQLDRLELVYSARGVASGVSYADQNALFLALNVMTVVALAAAAATVVGAYLRRPLVFGAALAVWLVVAVGLGALYPEIVQRFSVQPNEFALEKPYIENNIRMTRLAFNLDDWEEIPYRGEGALTAAQVEGEKATFENARLWDYRPLGATLDQLQTVRQYYDFYDVDADRYMVGDRLRQVWVSAREIAPEKNPQAQSWVNQRITYTHGFGVAMVPVNEVTAEGLPALFIRDMPPVSAAGAPVITEPRIYFGERPNDYVIVGALQPEFDYPVGEAEGQQQTTSWSGTTGIRLDSMVNRLLFALRFRDLNLVLTDQITDQSQLLMHRTLGDRLPRIAPFLRYDRDPYLVVTPEGRLVYIQDAYTTTSRFPLAEPFNPAQLTATGLGGEPFNYLRNSVKIVVDAYDGTTTFYVADPGDPLVRAWQGVFPDLFRPIDELPSGFRAHLRVPEELFNVQTRVFATYHVQDPQTFYRNDDLWTVPAYPTGGQQLPLEAYYVVMRMPLETDAEFLLLQPMVPSSRPNMIAWIAARMDGDRYGATRVYRFPRDTTILGPAQIEARIDQDPIISSQVTLWGQVGSTVVRGNLIVIPVQDTLLYLEPVYLQSTSAQFPEFQKIIVASPTKVVWGNTLAEALQLLVAGGPGPGPSPSPSPGASPTPRPSAGPTPGAGDVQGLILYANERYELAQQALRDGDLARYAAEMELVGQALQQLGSLVAPTPAPTAAP